MGNRVDRSRKRRPGAQKGNLNALRHGAYSRQFKPTSKQGRLVRWVERELVSALGDPRPQETLILKRGGNEGVPMLGTGGGDSPQGRGAVGNIGAALSSLVARTPRGSKNVGVGAPSKAGPGPRLLPRRKVQLALWFRRPKSKRKQSTVDSGIAQGACYLLSATLSRSKDFNLRRGRRPSECYGAVATRMDVSPLRRAEGASGFLQSQGRSCDVSAEDLSRVQTCGTIAESTHRKRSHLARRAGLRRLENSA